MADMISASYSPGRTSARPYRWQDDARCAEVDPDLFFPDMGDTVGSQKAQRFCEECPVAVQCAQLGLQFEFGIFGGITAQKRRKLKKQMEA